MTTRARRAGARRAGAREGAALRTRTSSGPRRRGPAFPCARCGTLLKREPGNPVRLRCATCRYRIYDYPRPCAGVIVLRGSDMLVLRRGHPPKLGWLDTPGGFIDAGESIEGAARRELFEETGLRAGRLEWLGFYWDRYYLKGFGFFPTMNFYYLARATRGTPKAADDAASTEWVPLGRLGRAGDRFAWKHMAEVIRDARRLARGQPVPGAITAPARSRHRRA